LEEVGDKIGKNSFAVYIDEYALTRMYVRTVPTRVDARMEHMTMQRSHIPVLR